MEKEKNIFERIQAVSEAVKNVEKNLVVGTGNSAYKAVADMDVLLKVKEAEKANGIISIPVKQELVKSEIVRTAGQNGYEKITYVDVVKMTLRIINVDNPNETLDVESYGRGLDAGDKGFGKASTYARKYALLNAYKIATGVDPDQFKSEEMQAPKTPSDKRTMVTNYLMQDVTYCNNCLSHFGVPNVADLDDHQINTIFNNLKAKKIV